MQLICSLVCYFCTAFNCTTTMTDLVPIAVKIGAFVGAVQIVAGGINESDNERRAHGGLGGPVLGFFRGAGSVVLQAFNTIGMVASRLLPPKSSKFDGAHLADGLAVATGPAVLGFLLASIYIDAKRKGEFGLTRDPSYAARGRRGRYASRSLF